MVAVNSKEVNLRISIPLTFGAFVLKLIPKKFIVKKWGIDVDFSAISTILKSLKDQKLTIFVHSKSSEIVRVEVG